MSKIINNLNEFLEFRGVSDSPYAWARAFYKYTDCGPWAVFLTRDTPAYTEKHRLLIARDARTGKLSVRDNTPAGSPPKPIPDDILSVFGFAPDGHPEPRMGHLMRSLAAYVRRVKELQESWEKSIHERLLITGIFEPLPKNRLSGRKWVLIVVERRHPETFNEVYYEDLRRGDPPPRVDNENCAGIKIGSIVEGSEVCYGPDTFMFPFEAEKFDRSVENMKAETSFYWVRDNSTWYVVRVRDREYYCHRNWDELKWDGNKPSHKIVKALEALTGGNDYDKIPEMPHVYRTPRESDKDWKPYPVPGTTATIHSYQNDGVY
jgi:hypothetical protein